MTKACSLCDDGSWPIDFIARSKLPGCPQCQPWADMASTYWETDDLALAIVEHYEHHYDDKPVPECVIEARANAGSDDGDDDDFNGSGRRSTYTTAADRMEVVA